MKVYLVDDGSTDGTSEAVQQEWTDVQVIRGDGTLFWNHGMRRAFSEAVKGDHPFYLWLNDDTILLEDSLTSLLDTHRDLKARQEHLNIVVGSTRDPGSGRSDIRWSRT